MIKKTLVDLSFFVSFKLDGKPANSSELTWSFVGTPPPGLSLEGSRLYAHIDQLSLQNPLVNLKVQYGNESKQGYVNVIDNALEVDIAYLNALADIAKVEWDAFFTGGLDFYEDEEELDAIFAVDLVEKVNARHPELPHLPYDWDRFGGMV